ncbi:ribosomal maturation YjgA family protein [Salinimicrobium soli]|uniref:ribosomal maturation YjgA family protein n=1 Tax=Salinimicrobium soli TaxID=1254399 RepID=UPI003AAC96B3
MLTFQKSYFFAALLLFLLLVFIAVYVSDTIIRPYGGDVLVVIFLYCLLKSFLKMPVKNAIFGVLLFAFLLEGLQAFDLVGKLGLQGNPVAVTILGNHFDFGDLLLYLLGGAIAFLTEIFLKKSFRKKAF